VRGRALRPPPSANTRESSEQSATPRALRADGRDAGRERADRAGDRARRLRDRGALAARLRSRRRAGRRVAADDGGAELLRRGPARTMRSIVRSRRPVEALRRAATGSPPRSETASSSWSGLHQRRCAPTTSRRAWPRRQPGGRRRARYATEVMSDRRRTPLPRPALTGARSTLHLTSPTMRLGISAAQRGARVALDRGDQGPVADRCAARARHTQRALELYERADAAGVLSLPVVDRPRAADRRRAARRRRAADRRRRGSHARALDRIRGHERARGGEFALRLDRDPAAARAALDRPEVRRVIAGFRTSARSPTRGTASRCCSRATTPARSRACAARSTA